MKVKMADVAKYLGLSKATVSLAVNGRPGVGEQTRQKILQCIEEIERNDGMMPEERPTRTMQPLRMINVVILNHRKQVVCDPELDLWSEVLGTFDAEARKRGYLYGISYLNEADENQQAIIDECNLDIVAGVILFGTEMSVNDYKIIAQIHKPLIIYDYEMPDGSYSSVCIDNAKAVEMALHVLGKAGVSNVCYLGTGKDVYNFEKRREAYRNILSKGKMFSQSGGIIALGNTIEEITERAVEYLNTHKLPEAFLMENYQVSIGMLTACRKLSIAVPGDLKLVGIDEVPDYAMVDTKLTYIRIPHAERAAMAMSLLDKEIVGSWRMKIKAFAMPELKKGGSA